MDIPTLILFAQAGLGAVAAVGFLYKRKFGNADRRIVALEAELAETRRLLRDANFWRDHADGHAKDIGTAYQKVRAERDEALRIAETHTVKLPDPPKPVTQVLWKGRGFAAHPKDLPTVVAQALDALTKEDASFVVTIVPSTAWCSAAGHVRSKLTLKIAGTSEQVRAGLTAWLCSKDLPFTLYTDRGLVWRLAHEPVEATVDASVTTTPPTPQVVTHTMEVAVVSTELQVVEKAVQAPQPEDKPAPDDARFQADVEVALEAVLARRTRARTPAGS